MVYKEYNIDTIVLSHFEIAEFTFSNRASYSKDIYKFVQIDFHSCHDAHIIIT